MLGSLARNHESLPLAGSAEPISAPWPNTGPDNTNSLPLYDTGDRKLEWSGLNGRSPKNVPGVCGIALKVVPSVVRRMRGGGSFVRSHITVLLIPKAYSA